MTTRLTPARRWRLQQATRTHGIDTLGPPVTAVLILVIRLHAEGVAVTGEHLVAATGLAKQATWEHLRRLRRAGLVTWERGRKGTIRPTLALVAFTAPKA